MMKPFLIALSAILVSPNFVDKDIQFKQPYNGKEKFSPQLSFINSIDKMEKFVDEAAADKKIAIGSLGYTEILENVVSHRFFNATAHKTLCQDWISAATDKFAGTGYSRLINPGEIMQYPNADCAQQTAVIMDILNRKNIPSREIAFPDHSVVEAFVNGNWYLLDASLEPVITPQQRLHQDWYGNAANLKKYYNSDIYPGPATVFGAGEKPAVHKTNEGQQANLLAMQAATGVLSKMLWIFPIGLILAFRKRSFKMHALKPVGKYVRMQTLRPVYNS